MSLEFVDRICPICENPNYMILLGDFSKAYKYKCMNCNRYFNDIDFEKEPIKSMNTKVDMVEVVRCKDCKHNYKSECPCFCTGDPYYSWVPDDNWFCADGERQEA